MLLDCAKVDLVSTPRAHALERHKPFSTCAHYTRSAISTVVECHVSTCVSTSYNLNSNALLLNPNQLHPPPVPSPPLSPPLHLPLLYPNLSNLLYDNYMDNMQQQQGQHNPLHQQKEGNIKRLQTPRKSRSKHLQLDTNSEARRVLFRA